MKRILYSITALITVFLLSHCGRSNQKPTEKDTSKVEKISTGKQDTSNYKHLAFFDQNVFDSLQSHPMFLAKFFAEFKPVPKSDFQKYYSNFITIFNPGGSGSIINYIPLTFSIYDKYNDFQNYLNLQSIGYTDILSGINFKNKIRIYPAIDTNKQLYLVLMGERQDTSSFSKPAPVLDTSIFYSIKDDNFDMVHKGNEMTQTKIDIKNFQNIWIGFNQTNPGLTFDAVKSFSYSIEEYNELLSNIPPFWDVVSDQTNSASNMVVRIYPVIDEDNLSHVKFRLILKLGKKISGGYSEITSKPFFDDMDPCPRVCPDPASELK